MDGWTIETLKAYLEERDSAIQRLADERFHAQEKAVEQALASTDRALSVAWKAAQDALEQRASTLDREFHEHLEQVRHENALAFLNSDKAVEAALASQKEAVNKAETAAERRFESVNEFRQQLGDQAGTFYTRVEAAVVNDRNAERINDLRDRLNLAEGSKTGSTATMASIVGSLTVIVIIVNVVIAYLYR